MSRTFRSKLLYPKKTAAENTQQYQNVLYAKVQDQEARCEWGISIELLHKLEATFALKASGIRTWDPVRDKILDLASGKGGHARELARQTGAHVYGFDLSQALIELGRMEIARESETFVKKVHLQMGDMLRVEESTQDKYKLITILGSSFIFFEKPEQIVEALKAYYQRLEARGKLVIQFRSPTKKPRGPQREDPQMRFSVENREEALSKGRPIPEGVDEIYMITDLHTGEYHYSYALPHHAPEGTPPEQIHKNKLGETVVWKDTEGIGHQAFERVYGAEGKEEPLGKVEITELNRIEAAPILAKKFLEAGFQNVKIEEADLANSTMMFAVIGEKGEDE